MAENNHFQLVPNKKAKSDVWGQFWIKMNKQTQKPVENVAVCRHCDQSVKYCGGTSLIIPSQSQPSIRHFENDTKSRGKLMKVQLQAQHLLDQQSCLHKDYQFLRETEI